MCSTRLWPACGCAECLGTSLCVGHSNVSRPLRGISRLHPWGNYLTPVQWPPMGNYLTPVQCYRVGGVGLGRWRRIRRNSWRAWKFRVRLSIPWLHGEHPTSNTPNLLRCCSTPLQQVLVQCVSITQSAWWTSGTRQAADGDSAPPRATYVGAVAGGRDVRLV